LCQHTAIGKTHKERQHRQNQDGVVEEMEEDLLATFFLNSCIFRFRLDFTITGGNGAAPEIRRQGHRE
jgi:hypothetical protein